jgi:hypothetical protein
VQVTACHSITDDNGQTTEWSVNIEAETPYSPDISDDLCRQTRDLLRAAISDSLHLSIEHDE